MMTDVTMAEFLHARIAEDETDAQAVLRVDFSGRWKTARDAQGYHYVYDEIDDGPMVSGDVNSHCAQHVARHDPARVLAECEAKRAIVAECRALINSFGDWDAEEDAPVMWSDVNRRERSQAHGRLRTLAAVYADHPDYREEWRQ